MRRIGRVGVIRVIGVVGVIIMLLGYVLNNSSVGVSKIVDGDTLKLTNGKTVRLIGIDTPEKDQCYYEESTNILQTLIGDQKVRLETDTNEIDHFGRTLGYLYLADGKMVNEMLLAEGAGEYFHDSVNTKYQDKLIAASEKAHADKSGKWNKCGPCEVKGNYDIRGQRYYHLPGFRHYDQVVVNLDKSDRWFCGEKEAIDAGFTKARE